MLHWNNYSTTCSKIASTIGKHPFQCYNCYCLIHGKSSPLLRKYHRRNQLKYPRSDQLRATKSGVNHKYCSEMHLESAIKHRKDTCKVQKNKNLRMTQRIQDMAHKSWHQCDSAIPFLKTLHVLICLSYKTGSGKRLMGNTARQIHRLRLI